MLRRRQNGSDARLVVILKKVGARGNSPLTHPKQMILDSCRVAGYQAVIQRLVVGVIEPERLQSRLQPPVSLREELKPGVRFLDRWNHCRPELGGWWLVIGDGKGFPGLGEDIVEHQHCHVAADAVAAPGN